MANGEVEDKADDGDRSPNQGVDKFLVSRTQDVICCRKSKVAGVPFALGR